MIEPTKLWCSGDPAKGPSGIACWQGANLDNTLTIKKCGNKGRYHCGGVIVDSKKEAWENALDWATGSQVFVEEGAGSFKTAIKSQGEMRGYIEHVCDAMDAEYTQLNVSNWRRVIKEMYNISWPVGREAKKALSVKLVKEHFGIDVNDDEADAVLVGVAAMRMRLVN